MFAKLHRSCARHGLGYRKMNLYFLLCLLLIPVVVSVLELLNSLIDSIKAGAAFPWKKWIIRTISLLIMGLVAFIFLELNIFDNDWINLAPALVAYFLVEYLLGKLWRKNEN